MFLQLNNPDAVVVQKSRCMEKWRRQGNRFNNILIKGDGAPSSIVGYVNKDVFQQNCNSLFDFAIETMLGKPTLVGA